jgi:hypothetical protein
MWRYVFNRDVPFINGAAKDGSNAQSVIDEARNLVAFARFWDSELVQLLVLVGEGATKSATCRLHRSTVPPSRFIPADHFSCSRMVNQKRLRKCHGA